MKYARDWARQESSCRRLEDGLCRIAFTGVKLASLELIPLAAKRYDEKNHAEPHFMNPSPDDYNVRITTTSSIRVGF